MSGLKLRCPAGIEILAKTAFKEGEHCIVRDTVSVLMQCCKLFLVWFTHGKEEGFLLHSLSWNFNAASGVNAAGGGIHFIAEANRFFEVKNEWFLPFAHLA